MRTGFTMADPQLSKDAFDDTPDQVESQLSAVQLRANPMLPKLLAKRSLPQSDPGRRSDGSMDKSMQRGSASVRQTWKIGV
jgi:hypothetical protein